MYPVGLVLVFKHGRYSLEEVVGNTHWLDDRWAEKERLLSYFSRHQVIVCVRVLKRACVTHWRGAVAVERG